MKKNKKENIKSNLKGIIGEEFGSKLYNLLDPCCASELDSAISVTYSELLAMTQNSTLVEGAKYLITDYKTSHIIPNTTDLNDTNVTVDAEPLLVTAISKSELNPIAFSTVHTKDVIFYDIDNSKWGALEAPTSKGFIYRRIDTEKNIDMPQDFRGCVFRRWEADLTAFNSVASIYLLYNTSVSTGLGASGPWYSKQSVPGVSVDSFQDMFTFGDYENSKNVQVIGLNVASDIIANITVQGVFENVKIEKAGTVSVGEDFKGFDTIFCTELLAVKRLESYSTSTIERLSSSFLTVNVRGMFYGTLHWTTIIADGTFEDFFMDTVLDFRHNYISINGDGNTSGALRGEVRCYFVRFKNTYIGGEYSPEWNNLARPKYKNGDGYSFLELLVLDFTGSPKVINYNGNRGYSNIEASMDYNANLVFGTAATDVEKMAGLINIENSSGTQTISTIDADRGISAPVHQTFMLKPVAGLTIEIPFNDVANGFLNTSTVSANGTNGEVIFIEQVAEDRWRAYN